VIKGRKVILDSIQEQDLLTVYNIIQTEDVGPALSTTVKELNLASLGKFLFTTEPGTECKVFVIKYNDEVVGFVTLNNIHTIRHNAYIGMIAIDPTCKEKLLGLNALRTIIDYAFNYLNLHRLYGHTFSNNKRMNALYDRGGWIHEGTEREYAFYDGEWIDREIWGILRTEYKG